MVDLLQSARLSRHGFAHGFSTRGGGVSAAPFDAANLARNVGDAPEAVVENHRRLAAAVGYERLFELSQVHGAHVRVVGAGESPEALRGEEGDALVLRAHAAGDAVGVRVADCIPLLLADPISGDVAAVHAGWRGVEARIAEAALVALGAPPERVVAAIGPHIRLGQFEVGPEVADALEAVAHGAACVDRAGPRPHVDLASILVAQLRALGVREIDDVGGCTYAERARFFSFRRDGAVSGRQMGVIAARGVA